MLSKFCVDCGERLRVTNRTYRTWTAVCPDCYDGTEDSSDRERIMGIGPTPEGAQSAWHEARKALDE